MSELICSASSVNSQTGTMEMGLLHLQVKSGHRRSQSKMISILKKKVSFPAPSPPCDKYICLHELHCECLKNLSLEDAVSLQISGGITDCREKGLAKCFGSGGYLLLCLDK